MSHRGVSILRSGPVVPSLDLGTMVKRIDNRIDKSGEGEIMRTVAVSIFLFALLSGVAAAGAVVGAPFFEAPPAADARNALDG